MGAWIETLNVIQILMGHAVAPYVGAWIETVCSLMSLGEAKVAPYVGAWIETDVFSTADTSSKSHPTWVRGLKQMGIDALLKQAQSRTLRGCVD